MKKCIGTPLFHTNNGTLSGYDDGMSGLSERMPHVLQFPGALGTGMIVRLGRNATSTAPQLSGLHADIAVLINEYESVLSRFRDDSLLTAMGRAPHGGTFDFPDWTAGLFDLYDALCDATDGAIDPCIGEDLIRLGYDAQYSFTLEADATARLGAVHGRPTWRDDVKRVGQHGTTLITRRAVHLDVGACGKGYLVDLIAELISTPELLIDAGGDLRIRSVQPVTIALEDPDNTANAIGTASLTTGSFCASAPSRRHWQASGQLALHHLLNAIDGQPVCDVAATWVALDRASANYPTALADGLATALFVAEPDALAARFPFACALLRPDRTAVVSRNFPGQLFIRR
ncbi:thiamine biosynthesis lipoprotein ApbE [Bifidobacterium hapali]|uniref:FAD:protein FMN transferase n=2 Tax=Bifidobacterium hapali TaxID=1630172 RepID=A0A261FXP3_9BIFI|nr:thiamine biosynthesis lipoprotein ApbE [Bifidobacterium hapali]